MSDFPVAQVSEKNGEISMSVEETNRVRAQLGLKPLRVNEPKQPPEGIVAQTTESNGEISCSIEETNRVRALLGLKPLNLTQKQKEEHNVKVSGPKVDSSLVAERIQKARQLRELHHKMSGPTLGDLEDGVGNSAAAWVERSRRNEQAAAVASSSQNATQRIDDPGDYTSNDLQGIKVSHKIDEFQGEEPVILTLKDQGVMDYDDAAGDELENVELIQHNSNKTKRGKKRPIGAFVEDSDDDDDFEFDKRGTKRKASRNDNGHVIGAGGIVAKTAEEVEREVEAKLERMSKDALEPIGTKNLFGSDADYLNPDEVPGAKFKKKKKKKKDKSKKKSKREVKVREPASLADELEANLKSESVSNASEPTTETVNYGNETKKQEITKKRKKAEAEFMESMLDDDEDDLQDTITQSRLNVIAKNRNNSSDAVSQGNQGHQFVLEQVKRIQKEEDTRKATEPKGNHVTISSATEFAQSIDARVKEHQVIAANERNYSVTDNLQTDSIPPHITSMAMLNQNKEVDPISDGNTSRAEETQIAESKVTSKKQSTTPGSSGLNKPEFGQDEPLATGIGATLALLKQRGDLATEESVHAGRSNDSKPIRDSGKGGFKLEYRDALGRELTPQEAYRELCYKFHGVAPSKNTREKRERQRLEKLKQASMTGVDTPLGYGGAVREALEKKGRAYVVLSSTGATKNAKK